MSQRPRRLLPRYRPGEEPPVHQEQSPQSPTLPGVASVLTNTTPTNQSNQAQDSSQPRGQKRTLAESNDTPKKRGFKRLTTKEEVALFKICNQHASTFGKRSDICNWWRNVGEEFRRSHGRPYSWSSVKRKVELATKRRIKFLEDQQTQGPSSNATEDKMNPDWVAALDIWIPTWKRFDEAETERIARRDHAIRRRTTRGQWRSTGVQDDMFRRSLSHSPETELIALRRSYLDGIRAEAAENTADTTDGGVPFGSPSPPAPMSVRLPPGYENMFSAIQSTAQPSPPTQASLPAQASTQAQISTPLTFVPFTSTEEFIQEADSARIPTPNTDTQAEPVIPTVEPAFEDNVSDFQDSQDLEPADVVRMKEDLRQEMRAEWRLELERSRAALEEKLDSVQKTQEMILEMLRQGHT